MKEYLEATKIIDSDNESVREFALLTTASCDTRVEKAVALYYAVRDEIRYDPYNIQLSIEGLRASSALKNGHGYCVAKAILMAALARVIGIPSRLGFADVKNHLTSDKLKQMMQTDVFTWHGYTELLLDGQWIKLTPTFNLSLCEKAGIKPLDFDGKEDAIFHPFDQKGQRHMEYVKDHGNFADLPFEEMCKAFRETYPFFAQALEQQSDLKIDGKFENEASVQ